MDKERFKYAFSQSFSLAVGWGIVNFIFDYFVDKKTFLISWQHMAGQFLFFFIATYILFLIQGPNFSLKKALIWIVVILVLFTCFTVLLTFLKYRH